MWLANSHGVCLHPEPSRPGKVPSSINVISELATFCPNFPAKKDLCFCTASPEKQELIIPKICAAIIGSRIKSISLSAAKANTHSTGNGMRGSYKGVPHVGTTNYYLAAGKESPQDLVAAVEKGIYVTEIMGAHTANAVSGDFSFGASGILVEHGHRIMNCINQCPFMITLQKAQLTI